MALRGARAKLVALGIAVVAFAAIMLTLISTAIFPGLLRVPGALVCADDAVRTAVVSTSYGTSDGETVTESTLYCIDAQGWAIPANGFAAYASLAGMAFFGIGALIAVRLVLGRVRRRRAGAVAVAALLLGGCSWGTTSANAFDEQTSVIGPLYLDGAAEEVAAAIDAALGGRARVRSFVLYPGSAMVEAQDPRRPDHIDRYRYLRGKISDPDPVDVSRDEVEGTLFHLDELALDRVPDLVRYTVEHGGVEGGDVTHITARRRPGEPVEMTAHLRGLRGSGWQDFDAAGDPLPD